LGCRSFGISQVLIGLDRIGVVGLAEAMKKAVASGLQNREAITTLLFETLAADNYIPTRQIEAFRTALWREYLRYNQQDFSEFYSEVEVVVRGDPGEELDRFVQTAHSVFADFELRPLIQLEPPDHAGPNPQLVVRNETIVRGVISRPLFKSAVHKSMSDW
jgi:hypothetical protein